ncbi:hypothetical protein [Xenorhabdus szentirmaii]|uniref:Uncharacterized protein n=1 Tax=Xenorhabdus szentirmaii DSM 16338 TaxID=1427518 RepID=W1ITY1_9GAMM|nr:hypothetical protein [Xenorhabdus szentirmaii]PHM30599.1 hypothetical protein Xsze_04190 [Xenorhabdus szentirmaii DSM 16338]CDL81076.1 hypothetical protein XSR1_100119 [Xenorhabdus szentirmaii DSM 16338]
MENNEFEQPYYNWKIIEFISACHQLSKSVIILKRGNLAISPKTPTSRVLNKIINNVQDSIDDNIYSERKDFHLNNKSVLDSDLHIYTSILYKFNIINKHLKRIDSSMEKFNTSLNSWWPIISDIRGYSNDAVMELNLARKEIEGFKTDHVLIDKLISTKKFIDTFKAKSKSEDAVLLRKASLEFKEEINELDDVLAKVKIQSQTLIRQIAKAKLYLNNGGDTSEFINNIERYHLRPSEHINNNIVPAPAPAGVTIAMLCVGIVGLLFTSIIAERNLENAADSYNVVLEQSSRKTKNLFKSQQEFLISHVINNGLLNLSDALYGIKLYYQDIIVHILSKVKDLEDMMKGMKGALERNDWKNVSKVIKPIIKENYSKYESENLITLITTLIGLLSSGAAYKEIELNQ